jgi:hypothetical protein
MKQEFQDLLRIQINRYIFINGFAPTVSQLSVLTKAEEVEVKKGLRQLADSHALVLHPNSFDIWVAHPFALFPTLFWVESGSKRWWGNCAWCSFGISALSKNDSRIFTKMSGESQPLTIDVVNGTVIQNELCVHFPLPAKRMWDNVIYTCANMLVFEDTGQVDEWCKRHSVEKGQVLPIEQVWQLAKLWYGNYLDDSWTRKTPKYAESIFKSVGLTGTFWELG